MRLPVAAAAMLALLSGCATLNEDQCRTGDWQGIGWKDGQDGRPPERIEEHAKACSKYGILPDPKTYEDARRGGLKLFCTPPRGYRHGEAGRTYEGVCPPDSEPAFLAGYSDGLLVHAATQAASRAESDASSARGEARRYEREIADAERRAADEKLSQAERDAARASIRRLRSDRERALDRAEDFDRDAWRARSEADRLRARFAAYYGGA